MTTRRTLSTRLIVAAGAALTAAFAAAPSALAGGPLYYVTDLGDLGFDAARAYAINNSGWVTGDARTGDFVDVAALWRGAGTENLGSLMPSGYATGFAISDAGHVAGSATVGFRGQIETPMLWTQGGGMVELMPGASGAAYGVNSAGLVVGVADDLAFVHDTVGGTTWTPFLGAAPEPGFANRALAVNNAGTVVGSVAVGGPFGERAFSWTLGDGAVDLGTLGGGISQATAISEAGHIVGWSETDDFESRAFMHTGSGMTDLGAPDGFFNSFATGVNSDGLVVGYSSAFFGSGASWLWDDGVFIDLNLVSDLPFNMTILQPTGINDDGWIVAVGRDISTFETRALLLTPVPTPGSALVLTVAAFAAASRRRRA